MAAKQSKQTRAPEPDEPQGAAAAPAEAEKAVETQDVARGAPSRLTVPVAPPARTSHDPEPLRHLREALEVAGFRNHPQALEAALEKADAVRLLRASRGVQAYAAEVRDYLRGKIEQRDAKAAS